MTRRQEKVQAHLRKLAAEFLERESNHTSLITVTGCSISEDLKHATIYVSIFPETKEAQGLDFANRHANAFREYVKDRSTMKFLPRFVFEADTGEKRRRKIDDLLRNP